MPLILIFGLAYVFFLRPRAQQARRQRDTLMELTVGDEVLTGAGIFGTVLDVESDRVTLETAPGTRITVLRSTIARKIVDPAVDTPSWDEHDEDEAHGAYQEYEHAGHDEDDEHDEADDHDGEVDAAHDETDEHDEHDEHDEADQSETPAVDGHVDAAHDTDGAPDGADGHGAEAAGGTTEPGGAAEDKNKT